MWSNTEQHDNLLLNFFSRNSKRRESFSIKRNHEARREKKQFTLTKWQLYRSCAFSLPVAHWITFDYPVSVEKGKKLVSRKCNYTSTSKGDLRHFPINKLFSTSLKIESFFEIRKLAENIEQFSMASVCCYK